MLVDQCGCGSDVLTVWCLQNSVAVVLMCCHCVVLTHQCGCGSDVLTVWCLQHSVAVVLMC